MLLQVCLSRASAGRKKRAAVVTPPGLSGPWVQFFRQLGSPAADRRQDGCGVLFQPQGAARRYRLGGQAARFVTDEQMLRRGNALCRTLFGAESCLPLRAAAGRAAELAEADLLLLPDTGCGWEGPCPNRERLLQALRVACPGTEILPASLASNADGWVERAAAALDLPVSRVRTALRACAPGFDFSRPESPAGRGAGAGTDAAGLGPAANARCPRSGDMELAAEPSPRGGANTAPSRPGAGRPAAPGSREIPPDGAPAGRPDVLRRQGRPAVAVSGHPALVYDAGLNGGLLDALRVRGFTPVLCRPGQRFPAAGRIFLLPAGCAPGRDAAGREMAAAEGQPFLPLALFSPPRVGRSAARLAAFLDRLA